MIVIHTILDSTHTASGALISAEIENGRYAVFSYKSYKEPEYCITDFDSQDGRDYFISIHRIVDNITLFNTKQEAESCFNQKTAR